MNESLHKYVPKELSIPNTAPGYDEVSCFRRPRPIPNILYIQSFSGVVHSSIKPSEVSEPVPHNLQAGSIEFWLKAAIEDCRMSVQIYIQVQD